MPYKNIQGIIFLVKSIWQIYLFHGVNLQKPNDLTFEERKPLEFTRLIVRLYVSILTLSVKMRYFGPTRQIFFSSKT